MWPGDGSELEILQLLWRGRDCLLHHSGVGEKIWLNHGSMKKPVTYCSMNMSLTRRLFKPLIATKARDGWKNFYPTGGTRSRIVASAAISVLRPEVQDLAGETFFASLPSCTRVTRVKFQETAWRH